ncbi:AraC family transcriptional regulator [Paenibacillus monticola]|uniref:ABC transporter substrate-binding protein n=1 Tax=Paenibacillus monticola TaxID=2666075 RepID=A0A7X2H2X3_9BACL|nr:AraC family transcriptional regulator [Paenibacillus monticola]MRN51708.1 ABC transporter substrate-binding protein [Paenibacillus monticola]
MPHSSTPAAPLRSLLFQLTNIEFIVQPAASLSPPEITERADQHTLLVFTSGSGTLFINDDALPLRMDKSYLLSPGESFHTYGNDITLYYYKISFLAIYINGQPEAYTHEIFPGKRELIAYPFHRMIRLIEDLFINKGDTDDIPFFKQQLRFQELLLFLFEHNSPSEHNFSPAQSVESTITYLQNHYMDNITVRQLAEQANVSSWQYTPIFQKLTGKKPLDFLTELRIYHSKQLLLHSGESLREIAHLVGFTDEYYFNRRFRQKTGITPGQYAQSQRPKVEVKDWTGHVVDIPDRPKRIVYHGETLGDLLALGVKPVGGDEAFTRNSVYKHRLKKLANVGFPLDVQRTGSLDPDLIIIANPDEREYNRVAKIAPTLTFNSFAPLEERLPLLGSWLGKEREAAAWLNNFAAKNAAMWQRLYTDILQPGATASALLYDHGHHLYVMGTTGLASALYAACGFQPEDRVRDILAEDLGFAEVELHQLHLYAGDHIFMLIPESADSRFAMEQLLLNPLWNSLPAVQKGHVYLLDGTKWNSADALTREKLLLLLPRLLVGAQPSTPQATN